MDEKYAPRGRLQTFAPQPSATFQSADSRISRLNRGYVRPTQEQVEAVFKLVRNQWVATAKAWWTQKKIADPSLLIVVLSIFIIG